MASSSRSRSKKVASKDRTDLPPRFKTPGLREKFNNEWLTRPIHQMRDVNFADFEAEIREIFEFQNLVDFMSWGYLLFPEPTLLFYLHLEKHDQGNLKGIKTFVYGEDLVFTEDDIIEFCGGRKEGWTARRNDTLPQFLAKLEPQYRRTDAEVSMMLCGNPNVDLKLIVYVKQLCPLAKKMEQQDLINERNAAIMEHHGHTLQHLGGYLKRYTSRFDVHPTRGLNRLLDFDPASAAHYEVQPDDFELAIPPPVSYPGGYQPPPKWGDSDCDDEDASSSGAAKD